MAAILDDQKSHAIALLAIQINTQSIGYFLRDRSIATGDMKLMGAFRITSWHTQSFLLFSQMAFISHFVFRFSPNRWGSSTLVINCSVKYEFDMCIGLGVRLRQRRDRKHGINESFKFWWFIDEFILLYITKWLIYITLETLFKYRLRTSFIYYNISSRSLYSAQIYHRYMHRVRGLTFTNLTPDNPFHWRVFS